MKDKKIIIAIIICALSIIAFVFAFLSYNKSKTFVKPKFEINVKKGIPEIKEKETFKEFEVSENYIVYMNGETKLKDNKLNVYFTSKDTNEIYVKLRVLKDNEVVGETGLLHPGEYVEYVKVKSLKKNDKITLKIMGYEKDTYYSAGAMTLNTKVW